jgi:tellurite resistance protein
MTRQPKRILAYGFILAMAFVSFARGETLAASEKQKIETLIKQVANLKDAKFVRNGSTYNADSAATFLRRKWQANQSQVKTALDFIDKVAAFSGTSGKPYLIRFEDGKEIRSRDFLLTELKKLTHSQE